MPLASPRNDVNADGKPSGIQDVFFSFLRLGLTSFGGPIAHLGYFRREFVEHRKWLTDSQFAQLLALCQFLPGPASSQLGFSIGLLRGGWCGALAAFAAFTLPSALLLFVLALITPHLTGSVGTGLIHGFKLVALVVVAHGVWVMAAKLCPDLQRRVIAVIAAVVLLLSGGAAMQIACIVIGAVLGMLLLQNLEDIPDIALTVGYGRVTAGLLFAVFIVLLIALPLLAYSSNGLLAVAEAFYRAGSLVFGGGHVVLPFLEQAIVEPGWLSRDDFMTGYGAAQIVPGPMFTLSAYLGAHLSGTSGGIIGAVVALVAIFLPGFLLVSSALPLWHCLATHPMASRVIAGINASVVGLLAAALYDPVWVSAVEGVTDVLIALVGVLMLSVWRRPVLVVVLWCTLASIAATMLA